MISFFVDHQRGPPLLCCITLLILATSSVLQIRIDMVKIMSQGKSESAYASIRKRTTVDEPSKQKETAIQATQERFQRSRCSNNPPQDDKTVIYHRHQSTHELQEDRLRRVASSKAEKLVVPELRQENIQAVNLDRDSGLVDHLQEQKQASGKSFPFSSIASNATGVGVTPIKYHY